MDAPERPSAILLAVHALLLVAIVAGMVSVVSTAWAIRTEEFDEMLWLVPGMLVIGGTLAWIDGIILIRQMRPGTPRRHEDRIVLEAPRSMRRATTAGLVGLVLLGAATSGILTHWVYTGETPMTSFRWLLFSALIAVFLGLTMILALGWRVVRGSFVADGRGLSWDRLLRRGRIEFPWSAIQRLELRGRWLFTTRWVLVQRDGEAKLPIAFDPTIPMSRPAVSKLVQEIEALRPEPPMSAAEARREGVEPPTF
jgi:hypothetical protein